MKNFKEYLNEVEKNNQLAKSVTREKRPSKVNTKQVGFLHFAHGVDYDVIQADAHDLAYFGKGVVRLKGRTTGKESVAYVDWKNGTIRFNSGSADDKEFDKAVKFKAASLYESLEDLELMEQLAEKILSEAVVSKNSPNVKKIVAALKKKFDVDIQTENKKEYNKETESYDHETILKIEYYEKGEDSEPIGIFSTSDDTKFRFGEVYSKARSDHGKEFDVNHILSAIKSGHYDKR